MTNWTRQRNRFLNFLGVKRGDGTVWPTEDAPTPAPAAILPTPATPGTVTVESPPPPPPLPPVAEVVTPDPVDEEQPRPRLKELHFFEESYDGTRHDGVRAKIGWPRERLFVHANDGGAEHPTKTSRVGQHVHSLHFNFAPWNDTTMGPNMRKSRLEELVARAVRLKAVGVSFDQECHTIMWGPTFLDMFYRFAANAGLPLTLVPNVGFSHLLVQKKPDEWSWPVRFAMQPTDVCGFLSERTAKAVQWYYGASAEVFLSGRDQSERYGYTKPIIPMMDGVGRLAAPDELELAEALWEKFGSLGIFNAGGLRPKTIEFLQQCAKE